MPANSITTNALGIITAAMQEIGALAPGESPSNEDQAWVLQKLQRLIDRYNARWTMIYGVTFSTYNLIANHAVHTLGPTGDFVTSQRPQSIESISVILNTPSGVGIPLMQRDRDWWADNRIMGLASSLPTDFYYSPDWPNGSIYFWPVSTVVYPVTVQTRNVLTEFTGFNQGFTMPPAYWDAIVYELAISLGPSFEREASQTLIGLWKAAIKAVQVNNLHSPRIATDAPTQRRVGWNFLTGGYR